MRCILSCDSLLSPCGFEQYVYFLNDIVNIPVFVAGDRYLLYMKRQYFLFVPWRQFQPQKNQPLPCKQIFESGSNFQIGSSPPTKMNTKSRVQHRLNMHLHTSSIWKIEWDPSRDFLITIVSPIDHECKHGGELKTSWSTYNRHGHVTLRI